MNYFTLTWTFLFKMVAYCGTIMQKYLNIPNTQGRNDKNIGPTKLVIGFLVVFFKATGLHKTDIIHDYP